MTQEQGLQPKQACFDFVCEKCGDKIIKKEIDLPYRKCITRPLVEQLIARRKELEMTQEEVNHIVGLGDRYLSKWEAGIKSPTSFNLVCWANALGCTIGLEVEEQ